MTDRYWLGTTDAVYSTAANWSATSGGAPGGVKPGVGDDVYFDGAGDNPCTLDEATAAINSLSVHGAGDPGGAYTALLDFNDQAVNVTGGGDMTFDGTGEVKCGTGTIPCSGNFDHKDQTTWTRETSTLVMNGTGKNIISGSSNHFHHLTIDGTITLHADTVSFTVSYGTLTVNNGKQFTIDDLMITATVNNSGTISINAGKEFRSAQATLSNSGTLSGAGHVLLGDNSVVSSSGTWSVATTRAAQTSIIGIGIYGGTWTCNQFSAGSNKTLTFGGNCVFTGDITFDSDKVNRTYTIDCATNDVDIEFRGDVSLQEVDGTATLTWSKAATGTVKFAAASGTQEYTDSTAAIQDLGNVVHDDGGGTGTLKLMTEMECSKFDGDDGSFDPNGKTLDCGGNVDWDLGWDFIGDANAMNGCTWEVGGNFTAENQTCKATAGWDLEVSGTAVASGTGDVQQCDANGVNTEIDASAGPWTDSGNNTNWNFGVAGLSIPIAMRHYMQMQGAG